MNQYHPYSISQKCSPSNHNHFSKLKRTGNNIIESTPIVQNVNLSEFISPLSPFSPSTFSNEYISNSESSFSHNSFLFNKLSKTTDSNNNNVLDEEILDIKAHKFILASRSGKFRELLKTSLIKLCKLNNVSLSCDQCLKMSMFNENNSNNSNTINAGGCSSINCLYKKKKNNNNNQSNNVNTTLNNDLSNNINNNNNYNANTSALNPEATSAIALSEVLCSSSYPSCSSSSSASSNQDTCKCSCTCQQ